MDKRPPLHPNHSPFTARTPSGGRVPPAADEDDAIAPIPNNTNSGGQRVTTPTTTAKSGGTPVNIRSDSNGRGNRRGSSAPKQRILAQAIHESQIHTNIRSSSTNRPRSATKNRNRRKQHIWDNDNLVGIYRYLNQELGDDDIDEHYESFAMGKEAMYYQNFGFHIDWRSNFYELFRPDNRSTMELFRKCQINPSKVNNKKYIRESEMTEAHRCWLRVEKRLRITVTHTLKNNISMCLFVQALESVLMYFIEKKSAPPMSVIPPTLTEFLESPLLCNEMKVEQLIHGDTSDNTTAVDTDIPETDTPPLMTIHTLTISLKDSSFHRLLLHATCQFYGLKSKSYNVKGRRVTDISLPKNNQVTTLSMVGWLHHTPKSLPDDASNSTDGY